MRHIDPSEIEHYEFWSPLSFALLCASLTIAAVAIITWATGTADVGTEMIGDAIYNIIH